MDGTSHVQTPAPSATSFIKWIVAGAALINLFVFGVVAFSLYQSFGETEENAELAAQNLSHILALDVDGTLDKVDITLLSARDEIERQLAGGSTDTPALNAFLGRLQARVPETISLRATDAEGIVRHGLGVNPAVRTNVSDREYFIRQRDNPKDELAITKPIFARIDKKWVVPVSRVIRRPDGSFGGVVYTNVALEHFVRTFSAIDVGRHGSISLRDAELRVFAVHPAPADVDKIIGEKLAIPELQALIQAGQEAGTYITRRTVDGVERKFAVHRAPDHPLYVVVGRATEEYMARWWDQALKTLVLVALFCLTTLISSWLIYRSWKRQLGATLDVSREEEKFHTVADYTYDWEYWEGPELELLYISPSCERVTGYSQAEFLGDAELLRRIIHPDDRHLMADHRHDAAHEDSATADFRILRRDGEIRWIAHACQPVFGRDGRFMGRRSSNRDITERKTAEATVHRLNADLEQRVARRTAQLEAASKELEEFSYSISHDLRTPLRAIAGFAQILVDEHSGSLDSEGLRLLDVVRANTMRMSQLIDELLEFMQLGRRQLEFAPVDTVQAVQEIFAELQASVPERKLHLELKAPPPIWGDRAMIRRLLTNLLSNAIKFTRPRPEAVIEVGGGSDGNECAYYVKDNGVGFDMRYVDKLFKVFERAHPVGQFEGSGTGLAMARRIVTRHGGRIWAESVPDAGATIHFTLPAKTAWSASDKGEHDGHGSP
jgi:PAS domain S-box-containing protein